MKNVIKKMIFAPIGMTAHMFNMMEDSMDTVMNTIRLSDLKGEMIYESLNDKFGKEGNFECKLKKIIVD